MRPDSALGMIQASSRDHIPGPIHLDPMSLIMAPQTFQIGTLPLGDPARSDRSWSFGTMSSIRMLKGVRLHPHSTFGYRFGMLQSHVSIIVQSPHRIRGCRPILCVRATCFYQPFMNKHGCTPRKDEITGTVIRCSPCRH